MGEVSVASRRVSVLRKCFFAHRERVRMFWLVGRASILISSTFSWRQRWVVYCKNVVSD